MRNVSDAGLRPFSESGYEILDENLALHGQAVIWSVDPLVPRLGDLFLVESAGRTHEVEVVELVTFKGGWSATCQVTGALD